MSIKKKHMNWMMLCKLPLGASLWAILFFFIFTACQDDAPYEDTEVMVTFTTRAVVTDKVDSNAPDEDKMQDLRVIMLRQDGTVVDNHLEENINASSVTFTFSTPIQIDGEDFTFLAVANEESIQSTSELSWITSKSGDNLSSSLSAIQTQQIGNGVLNINNGPIPQSKQWTVHVPQADTKIPTQRLDFVASKVSVEFKNETNKEQTLKNVRISGFGSATQAYLFKQNGTDFVGQQGVSDKYLLGDEGLTIPVGKSDSLKYYTYPVNTISTPTLHAQWKQGEEYKDCSLDLSGITSLPRNQQLKILITLTGQELVVNYTIAPWNADNTTNIGSPTIGGGYNTEDWTAGGDVNIGGDPVVPDEPDTPVGEGEVTVWGDKVGEGSQEINWSEEGKNLVVELSWLENAATITGPDGKEGILMYAYITITGTGNMQIRKVGDSTNNQYDGLYLNNSNTGWIGGLSSEKISVFIPNDVVDTQFYFSGQNYTIKKVTVVK